MDDKVIDLQQSQQNQTRTLQSLCVGITAYDWGTLPRDSLAQTMHEFISRWLIFEPEFSKL